MAKITDIGHEETEDVLGDLEKRIAAEYKQAENEVSEKLNEYLAKFEKKEALKKQALENGLITQTEYNEWRVGQIAMGQRWAEMRDTLANDYAEAAQTAKTLTYEKMPEVYSINYNYGTYYAETLSGVNTSYTLYSKDSVNYLFEDGDFYLPAGKKVTRAINMGEQIAWDKKQIQSVMIQSLLQGESIGKIATRLSKTVGESDRKAAVRNARTMTTCVQNAGRLNSFERAKDKGINIKKQWIATLDSRTRHEHRVLDGQVRELGEPFSVAGYELEYPADPNASISEKLRMQKAGNVIKGPAFLIYNCRCTILGVLDGHEIDVSDTSLRNTKNMNEESYEEWKESKYATSDSILKQDQIAETMQKSYISEYNSYKNSGKNNSVSSKKTSKTKEKDKDTTKSSSDKKDKIAEIKISEVSDYYGDVKTDVYLSEERIEHIKSGHSDDYKKYGDLIPDAIEEPDLVLNDSKNTNTALFIKKTGDSGINVVVKLANVDDSDDRSFVVTMHAVGESSLRRLKRKNELIYSNEDDKI